MKVETVLPRGKLDPGLRETVEPLDIDGYFEGAKRVVRIEIASAVAIAFPRSPTVTAPGCLDATETLSRPTITRTWHTTQRPRRAPLRHEVGATWSLA